MTLSVDKNMGPTQKQSLKSLHFCIHVAIKAMVKEPEEESERARWFKNNKNFQQLSKDEKIKIIFALKVNSNFNALIGHRS